MPMCVWIKYIIYYGNRLTLMLNMIILIHISTLQCHVFGKNLKILQEHVINDLSLIYDTRRLHGYANWGRKTRCP